MRTSGSKSIFVLFAALTRILKCVLTIYRLHVKNDLDPYVCLFEKCDSPDHLYSHSSTWVKHMKEHTLRWRCKSRAHEEFLADNKTDYVEHMRTSHPGKFTQAQLVVLADRNAHTSGALFTSCPLCGTDKTDTPMEHHVVGHMRLLALKSLPGAHEEMDELAGSEGQQDNLATSQPHSNSTIKHGLKAYYDEADNLDRDIESDSYKSHTSSWDVEDGQFSGQPALGPEFERIQWDFMPGMQSSGQDEQNDPIIQSFLQRALCEKESPSISIPSPGEPWGEGTIRIDPDCAICGLPFSETDACDCEAKALDIAVKQAENRIMGPLRHAVRRCVQDHAQGYMDRNPRKRQATLIEVNSPPQQPDLQSAAEDTNKAEKLEQESVNEIDKLANVVLPEVLDHYFSLVEFTLPAEVEPSVRHPPLGADDSYEEKESNPFRKSSYSKSDRRVRFLLP